MRGESSCEPPVMPWRGSVACDEAPLHTHEATPETIPGGGAQIVGRRPLGQTCYHGPIGTSPGQGQAGTHDGRWDPQAPNTVSRPLWGCPCRASAVVSRCDSHDHKPWQWLCRPLLGLQKLLQRAGTLYGHRGKAVGIAQDLVEYSGEEPKVGQERALVVQGGTRVGSAG